MAGDAIVGEEVGRVGEDEVDGVGGDFFEDFQAIALEDFDVMLGVVEDGGGEPSFAKASAFAKATARLGRDGGRFRHVGGFETD